MNKIGTQRIETERCVLRRIVPDDYEMMYENCARYEEVCRFFPFHPITDIEIYKEKAHNWIANYESNTYFHWVIELNRVQAEVFAGNIASEHVLKKCGMRLEGIARQKYCKDSEFIDAAQYAILRKDFI